MNNVLVVKYWIEFDMGIYIELILYQWTIEGL